MLERHSDSNENNKASNILKHVLNLFKSLRPGSDLSSFKLPPVFNMPKSQLQCSAECVYSTAFDLLSSLNNGKTPLDRFISVVAWSISTTRPTKFGAAPYNPILGETHHVSKGNLNVLLEQVSHHPPVSALHATDQKENIEIIWCQIPVPKFIGKIISPICCVMKQNQFLLFSKCTAVEAKVHGKRQLKLHNHGETYEMSSPHILFRFLPVPGTDWFGNVRIQCLETGLVADLTYMSQSFFGFRGNRRLIKGKIFDSLSMKVLYEIHGHWDSTVTVKDTTNEEIRVIYDAKKTISGLQAPFVKDPENVWTTESALVWSELSQAILSKDWEKAREAKNTVEDRQRKLMRERESKGETWVPKHFIVSKSQEGWDCSPIQKWVPTAPIATL
ncbi:oxysterol-binding protein-related protein 4B-like isoform X2 [Lotus japonicus]|nr:oxysterol-binding protein-related protein 4B-like isoform X2 [Lotus japonicus]XP_057421929.1 oxysterol-binding protein-related protein 4B-like isoform X2 [Lotus japonicus]